MQSNQGNNTGFSASGLLKNRDAIEKLAASEEAQQLFRMLEQRGGVHQAAQAAAGGNTGALAAMVEGLMQTKEGESLIRTIRARAKQAGLD